MEKEEIALEAGKKMKFYLVIQFTARLSEPQAAMGIQQLQKLDKFIE